MLNPFPSLLMFGFFAPMLLRIAVALVFFLLAYRVWRDRGHISRMHFPIVGQGAWIPVVAVLAYVAVGGLLFIGYYTQIAALLGAIGSIKGILLRGRFPRIYPASRGVFALMLVIFLSLLATGAGAFAFDLPL